ncbi:LysR substrate-binding domain-containing protein [Castellaniella sp. GW247-6E4]|uniref:LysR family transcriptional regulator n=1 Tax=Castellaniella sp. GW247-6E4 TaxID=3140380 RepID=UPI003314E562
MNAQSLILLVDIIDAGNLSKAARTLKMSRANISYHLTQLEQSLGQQLLRRTTRRVEPTELGLKLYQHGRIIRDELLAARESVDSLGRGLHGSVRLSLPTGFGHLIMSDWMIEFKRAYPDIALDVVFENRIDDLLREEIDIAVRVMSEPPQHMVAHELCEVRHVICASAQYALLHGVPERLEDLPNIPLITSTVHGRALRLAAYQGQTRREIMLNPTLASENFQFLREAILAGLGVGLVPDYLVASAVADRHIVLALDDWRLSVFGTRMFLLRMPGRYQTLAARTLIDFVIQRTRTWAAA